MPDTTTAVRFVDEALLLPDAAQPTLRGSRCADCRTTAFPAQDSCPRCGGIRMATVPLPRSGVLWSFTVQAFEPKPPYRGDRPFEPFGVGYVDLGPVIIETRLTENDAERLAVGQPMELTLVPAFRADDGATVFTYAFAVAAGGAP